MVAIPRRMSIILRHPLTLPFYLPVLLFNISIGLIRPIRPLYAADFDVSYVIIGIILAGDALGTMLGDLPAGILLRRMRDKQVMIIGLMIIVVSMILLSVIDSVVLAVLFLFVFGVGRALFNVSTHMYLMTGVRFENRGRAIAVFGGTTRIGSTIGPVIGGTIATIFNLRTPFLFFAGLCVLSILLIVMLLRTDDTRPQTHEVNHFSMKATLTTNSRTLAVAGAGQLFAQMIRAGRDVILPLYGADVLGLDAQTIGLIVSISWALDMVLFYPAGWIMDNLGRKFAIVPCFFVQALGMALVAFTTDVTGLLFAAGLIGLANGVGSGTMMTLGADLAPSDSRGDFLGIWRLVGDMGSTGAPLVVGWVAGVLVLPAAAGALSLSGLLAAGIFAFLLPETLRQSKEKG